MSERRRTKGGDSGSRDPGAARRRAAARAVAGRSVSAIADGSAARKVERIVGPALRVVPERVAAPARAPFVALVVLLLAGGLVALLLLNVALTQDSYRVHQLQQQTALQAEQKAALQQQVALDSAPGALARKAEDQGMVPAGGPAYLEVPSGKVEGSPSPAARGAGDGGNAG